MRALAFAVAAVLMMVTRPSPAVLAAGPPAIVSFKKSAQAASRSAPPAPAASLATAAVSVLAPAGSVSARAPGGAGPDDLPAGSAAARAPGGTGRNDNHPPSGSVGPGDVPPPPGATTAAAAGSVGTACGVSLCVPCIPRDVQRLAEGLLPSVAAQTLPPLEVVVGLSEATAAEAAAVEARLQGQFKELVIRVVGTEFPMPPGLNRNRAAAAAKGCIVSFMDADDTMHPQRNAIVNTALGTTPRACVLHGFTTNATAYVNDTFAFSTAEIDAFVWYGGQGTGEMGTRMGKAISKAQQGERYWPMQHHGHISCLRSVMETVHFPDLKAGEDIQFTNEVSLKYDGGIGYIGLPLSTYRPSGSGLIGPTLAGALEMWKVVEKNLYRLHAHESEGGTHGQAQ